MGSVSVFLGIVFGVAAVAAVIFPIAAFAQINLNLDYPAFGPFDLNENQSLPEIIGFFYYFIVIIAGLAAFVMLVWGGVQWLVSGAAPAQASEARDRIKNAVLGLLLILASFLIIQIINPELTFLRSEALADPCESPDYSAWNAKCKGALGSQESGIFLCEDEFCKGEYLYIDPSIPGCDDIRDFRNMPTNCDPDKKSTSTRGDFDNRLSAVKFDHTSWTLALFEDVDRGGRAICFRSTALDLGRYQLTILQAASPGLQSWNEKASAMRAVLVGGFESCATHGITLPDERESSPRGRTDQPVVFFFNLVDFATVQGRWNIGLPIETWAPDDTESISPKPTRNEYFPGAPKNISSILVERAEKRCLEYSTDSPPFPGDPALGKCAVFVSNSETDSPGLGLIDLDSDPYICFISSITDTEERDPVTGKYKYSFDCSGDTPITTSVNKVEVLGESLCPAPGVVQNCS